MDKLWAPWRIKYIIEKKDKTCLFCKIVRNRRDKKHYVFFKTKDVFSLLNIYPYNNGHIMVVPKRHISSFEKISAEEWKQIQLHINVSIQSLKSLLKPEGFNIGINIGKTAGAGIDKHLHIHIVPRWGGDTNFMPVTAETKVISQSLQELYRALRKKVEELV